MKKIKPELFKGGVAIDARGSVSYNNNLQLKNIKRFYIVENFKKNFVRAWHGHKVEGKYILCIKGKAKVSAIKVNNFKKPSKILKSKKNNRNQIANVTFDGCGMIQKPSTP